jgi:23S rRNA pseudouridine1911/1915/1917 synthase
VSSPPERIAVVVTRTDSGGRLDQFLARALLVSRSELQRWIAAGRVTVQGAAQSASVRVREGDCVVVDPPPPAATEARPDADVRFQIIHVDDDLVVVNKPPGLVVHPARGHPQGTLVNGLLASGLFSLDELEAHDAHVNEGPPGADRVAAAGSGALGGDAAARAYRPGIVHRLDKGTSGVMVVARTAHARDILAGHFRSHTIERAYEAIVVGIAQNCTFDTPHGRDPRNRLRFTTRVREGKSAVTHVRVIARLYGTTHVECTIETGRTHQIRVHLAESGTPVLGDPLYGKAPRDERVRAVGERLGRQALHARLLGFVHPRTGERVRFEVPIPEDFRDAIRALT